MIALDASLDEITRYSWYSYSALWSLSLINTSIGFPNPLSEEIESP